MTPGLIVRSILALLVSTLGAALLLNHAAVPPVSAINAAINDQSSGPVFVLPAWLSNLALAHRAAPQHTAVGTPQAGAAPIVTPAAVPTQRAVVINAGVQISDAFDVKGHIFFTTPNHNIAFITGQHARRLFTGTGDSVAPALSPDGRNLAWVYFKRNYSDIYVTALGMMHDGSVKAITSTLLTQNEDPPPNLQVTTHTPGYDPRYEWWGTKPSWMPDGQHVLYLSDRPGFDPTYQENAVISVYEQSISDTIFNATRLTIAAPGTGGNDSAEWRPGDPSTFIYVNYYSSLAAPEGQGVIEVNSAITGTAPSGNPTDLTPQGIVEYHPAWSPNGRYIAFAEDKGVNVRSDLRIMPFTPPGTLQDYNRAITVEAGHPYITQPFWSPDGRYLGYLRSNGAGAFDIVLRRVGYYPAIHFGPPHVLDQAGIVSSEYRPSWGP